MFAEGTIGLAVNEPGWRDEHAEAAGVDVSLIELTLHVRRSGNVRPWLGPAFRGVVARRLKEVQCRHDPIDREQSWVYCTGCPFNASCAYGRLFEPDAALNGEDHPGFASGQRGVVLAMQFPVPELVMRDDRLRMTVKVVGRESMRLGECLLEAVAWVGERDGIGPDHVTFTIERVGVQSLRLRASDLPTVVTPDAERLPRVAIHLMSPLFLRSKDPRGRRPIVRPSLPMLVASAVRTVSRALLVNGIALEADFAGLIRAAATPRLLASHWEPFRQRRWSARQMARFDVEGCVGGAEWGDVPLPLIPWLNWGGLLHVGVHRVAGAGGWRIDLS
jgi:hypothetical protein